MEMNFRREYGASKVSQSQSDLGSFTGVTAFFFREAAYLSSAGTPKRTRQATGKSIV